VPAAELDAELGRLCAAIAAKSPDAVAAGKQLFYRQLETGIADAYGLAGEAMACNAIAPDARAGIAKFTRKG